MEHSTVAEEGEAEDLKSKYARLSDKRDALREDILGSIHELDDIIKQLLDKCTLLTPAEINMDAAHYNQIISDIIKLNEEQTVQHIKTLDLILEFLNINRTLLNIGKRDDPAAAEAYFSLEAAAKALLEKQGEECVKLDCFMQQFIEKCHLFLSFNFGNKRAQFG